MFYVKNRIFYATFCFIETCFGRDVFFVLHKSVMCKTALGIYRGFYFVARARMARCGIILRRCSLRN